MDLLQNLDGRLFLFINHLPHNPVLDLLMLTVSRSAFIAWVLFFVYIFFLIFIHKKNAGRGFIFLLSAAASGFALSDFGLKDFFHRPRPFLTLVGVIVVQKGLTDFSFPSGHAFSVSLLAALFIRRRKFFWPLAFYALLVGFSRIYLGVHYPFDVLGGYIFGFVYGLSVNHFYERFLEKEEFHILKHHVEAPS